MVCGEDGVANLDTSGLETALQQLCIGPKPTQLMPVFIDVGNRMEVLVHKPVE